jgi:RND family efflux transporter MFP subunit
LGVFLLALGAGGWLWGDDPKAGQAKPATHTVRYEKLDAQLIERGTLESAAVSDLVCRVKAAGQNNEAATTIMRVIEEGTLVKQGDLLLELDDARFVEQLKTQKIVLEQARAALLSAEENLRLVAAQGASELRTAAVAVDLASLDLVKYREGDAKVLRLDAKSRVLRAEADVELWKDRVGKAEAMLQLGQGSASELKARRLRLESASVALDKARAEQSLLEDYTLPRTLRELEAKVEQAQRSLERLRGEIKAREGQAEADRQAKRAIYEQEAARVREIEEQVGHCRLTAPRDGLVVYYLPTPDRLGRAAPAPLVAVGEPVREGQKLLRVVDLTRMQASIKVPEALVTSVRAGQQALVHVDAFPGRVLRGQVKQVATTASPRDWMARDVKVYETTITIDDPVDRLKPGMTATVTVSLGKPLDRVLAVPLRTLRGAARSGSPGVVYVWTPQGPAARNVVVGLGNEEMVEIKSGLKEGEEVLLDPRAVLKR